MTCRPGLHRLVKTFDVMDEGHIAGDIFSTRCEVVSPEVALELKRGELRADTPLGLLRNEAR